MARRSRKEEKVLHILYPDYAYQPRKREKKTKHKTKKASAGDRPVYHNIPFISSPVQPNQISASTSVNELVCIPYVHPDLEPAEPLESTVANCNNDISRLAVSAGAYATQDQWQQPYSDLSSTFVTPTTLTFYETMNAMPPFPISHIEEKWEQQYPVSGSATDVPAPDANESTALFPTASTSAPYQDSSVVQYEPLNTVWPQDIVESGQYPYNWVLNNTPQDGGYDVPTIGQLIIDMNSLDVVDNMALSLDP
ncbi:hypothetical protein BDQ17DRAFT_1427671 [Cyathus striatus]|nr:hypothetical protein BDQ17DRAFT_1427671 [Cyathus striatus]